MPQQPYRRPAPAGRRPPPRKKRRKKAKWPVYLIIVLVLFLVALLVSRLAAPNVEEAPSSAVPSLPVSSVPAASSTPPLGLYDEAGTPMLLNATHPLPEGYDPELANVGYGNGREQTMEVRAAAAFNAMKEAAQADGITLTPFSCYRSHQHQVSNYNASIERYVEQGYSRQKATELTQQYYAVPGTSEHEAGFAVDIDSIEESFENTPAFAWLQQNCTEYGFILRYAKTTEAITGIAYEPWHYRYVGANHAKAITTAGITLEEYVEGKG
ncbi:M15 family metallopeptidase [Ruminococcaceae bacterium OttesenSCG-928-A16]|nr:M15 family metallopeptidase [Ruminococcaceae bacterium OttesenSCG-928-A16]